MPLNSFIVEEDCSNEMESQLKMISPKKSDLLLLLSKSKMLVREMQSVTMVT